MKDRTRITLGQLQKEDRSDGSSKVRALEMRAIDRIRHLGVRIQFVRDLELYGLHEALMYLQGYEGKGEVEAGTTAAVRREAFKVIGVQPPEGEVSDAQ
jgi:ABC-type enterochelin transport system substrate-binding protein